MIVGISAKDLCRSPNDKHLVRLASELNIKKFHEFILHLGLKTKDWDQIGYNWGRAEDAKVVALLQWKERNEIVTFEKLLDAQACIGDNQHHLCKVGNLIIPYNSLSFKILIPFLKGFEESDTVNTILFQHYLNRYQQQGSVSI